MEMGQKPATWIVSKKARSSPKSAFVNAPAHGKKGGGTFSVSPSRLPKKKVGQLLSARGGARNQGKEGEISNVPIHKKRVPLGGKRPQTVGFLGKNNPRIGQDERERKRRAQE